MKSPNIMSITGRMPVIAAPTPRPVMPASEMGESMTLVTPNSSTNPDSTLNGVPASATSSPRMNTVGSRRISSASASRMAWPIVSSRMPLGTAGAAEAEVVMLSVDILIHLAGLWEWRIERKLHTCLDLLAYRLPDAFQFVGAGEPLLDKPGSVEL